MRLSFILFLSIFATTFVKADGIEFFKGTWEEALEEAEKQQKVIFVDAYASWCGPCKRMARNIFPLKNVGEFYNKNFINVKLDYEKKEADAFRKKYTVSAFPTLYWIDFDGSVVHVTVGGQQAESLIANGKMAISKIDRTGDYEELYEKGKRDPQLVHDYIKALNQSGKPSLKIANDFLQNQEDLTEETNLRIIYEAATEADSRVFDWMIRYRRLIERLYSKEDVEAKIDAACKKTVEKAVEYNLDMLHEEAIAKMKENCPDNAKKFALEADMIYYQGTGKVADYLAACKAYSKKILKKDAKALQGLSESMKSAFPLDESVLAEAAKIGAKAEKLMKKQKKKA